MNDKPIGCFWIIAGLFGATVAGYMSGAGAAGAVIAIIILVILGIMTGELQ